MLCRELSLLASGEGWAVARPLTCNAWNCDFCAPTRRWKLICRARAGQPNRFLTLTISPGVGSSPIERAHILSRAWKLITKRAKRQLGLKTLDYLAVFERTKRGEPHLHLLLRCGYLPQRWLSEQMRDIAGSPIVWIKAITDPKKAAYYVSKYIGKDPHRFGSCKRYWCSKNYAPIDTDKDEGNPWGEIEWRRSKASCQDLYELWQSSGLTAYGEADGTVWYGSPPPSLRKRWERPETCGSPAASPSGAIGAPACAPADP